MAKKTDSKVKPTKEELKEEVEEETPAETPAEEPEVETSEEETEQPPQLKKRFTQFKGETPEEYIQQLESAYANSTQEGQKLKGKIDEFLSDVANPKEPELDEETPEPVSPALAWAEAQMNNQSKQDWDSFVTDHPEMETDPDLQERMLKRVKAISKGTFDTEGRMVGMGEALNLAWKWLDMDNSTKEEAAMAAKSVASSTKTTSKTKPTEKDKTDFTPKQITAARKLLDPEGKLSDQEVVKRLAVYNK